MVYQIAITEDMRNFAAWCESEIYRIMPNADKHNYTGLNVPFRWYYGFLGEAIFKEFCDEYGLKYLYEPEVKGYADKKDFVLYGKKGNPVNINVKTASRFSATHMSMPAKQFARRHSEVYAAVRLINSHSLAQIEGWCTRAEIKPLNTKSKVAMVGRAYTDLRPMDDLLANAIKIR